MYSNKGHSNKRGIGSSGLCREGRKKKAFVKMEIIKIILIIFSFLLLFYFIYQFYSKSTEFANEQACHDSIMLIQALASKVMGGEYAKPWPATCKTKDIISKATTIEKAQKELAERMVWCYWMMGEGAIRPFDKDFFLESERKCFVCYTIQFPYMKGQIIPQEFMFYLQANGRKGVTYYDYLKYGQDKVIQSPLAYPINSQDVYVVVYTSPKAFSGMAKDIAGCLIVGVAAGAIATPLGGVIAGSVCAVGMITADILESIKEDVVYVAGANEGKSGCYGSWRTISQEVKTA